MAITFIPFSEDVQRGTIGERIEILLGAAGRYRNIVLELAASKAKIVEDGRRMVPREQTAAYNWEEIARVLRQIRELPENTKALKLIKAGQLTKLAEVYEVLRAAKMSKLEAVRLALMSEATQLRGDSAQVA
jgi:hypothetical protein